MSGSIYPTLRYLDALVCLVDAAAAASARAIRKVRKPKSKIRGQCLRPGANTPYWNELAYACEARLTRYGDKVRLARELGISRQRLHQLLVEKTACADAERTLELLLWLKMQEQLARPPGTEKQMSSII